ncbi:MAG TPA: efflux RND transporter periplasmic adaptor subunit [Candidatus Aquilonibacter sp.]|nr:efflux RND transporter periplasmic adaptor subunit [Candidatus Aquilonibacter sp.]
MNAALLKTVCCLLGYLVLAGCGKKFDPASGEVQPSPAIETGNPAIVRVQKPQEYPLVIAGRVETPNKLEVTGSVFPDINREIPVISLASGRVVDIRARLDDNVHRGQLLLKVQSPDVTIAFDTYLKAVNDELMANKAYVRARDLFSHGAISQAMLEQAQDGEDDAKTDLTAAEQQLKTLGVDKNHPSSIVNVYAPIPGVIVAQNVTNAAAAGVTYSGSSTAFTIADLSVVWIICDVYENDLPKIRLGQEARIRLTAYPDQVFTGRVSDISPVLDPTIRTAKVRIEVPNPGTFRLGMYVTATLLSRTKTAHAIVPATAVLHLHDRDWVFEPAGGNQFRRLEVITGDMLPGNMQEILSGVQPGQQVVARVLELEATAEAQ